MLHIVIPNRVRVVAGEKFGPGGVAFGGVVELREPQTVFSQLVEIGGLNLPAVTTDVRVAHVIYHDQNKVGARAVRFRPPQI